MIFHYWLDFPRQKKIEKWLKKMKIQKLSVGG